MPIVTIGGLQLIRLDDRIQTLNTRYAFTIAPVLSDRLAPPNVFRGTLMCGVTSATPASVPLIMVVKPLWNLPVFITKDMLFPYGVLAAYTTRRWELWLQPRFAGYQVDVNSGNTL